MKKKPKLNAKLVVISFFVLLFSGAAIALYLPLRPTYSDSEKRELTKFPEFSAAALMDGSYFNGISTWYADTFPFREVFMNVNSRIKSFYGIGGTISGFSDDMGDEIPVIPEEEAKPPVTSSPVTQATAEPSETQETTTRKPPKKEPIVQQLGNVLVVDNAGYEYYNFVRSIADDYAAVISRSAQALKGTARVFCMVVPTSMDIMLDESVRKSVNSSNQKDATNYIYSKISADAYKVKIFDSLKAHSSEYIYFRTDHHWTALGAYYAYEEYTKLAGLKTAALTDFEEKTFDNFVGSFYNDSDKNPALEKEPDVVHAWAPKGDVSMYYTDKKGNKVKWAVVYDVSTWSRGTKYNTFVAGDQPYTKITNSAIKDGSSCLVVKESFGNAMIPFLTENYGTVHVIDYRYWDGSVSAFVKEKGIQDVIYLNNISATRNRSLVNAMDSVA